MKRLINLVFTFIASVLLVTACQSAPPAQQSDSSGVVIRKGMFQLPGYEEPVELTYEVKNGLAIWEGDIILGEVDAAGEIQSQGVATNNVSRRSPNGVIPYAPFGNDPSLSSAGKANIQAAIDHWNQNTVVRFVPRTNHADYVKFVPGLDENSCSSAIGRSGGEQTVRLSPSGFCSARTLIHELGHTVGLHHEQNRTDRKSFVHILTQNIQFPYGSQFDIPGDALNLGSYDYNSIMHYSCTAFGIIVNGVTQPTIELINPPAGVSCATVGRGATLSAGDIAAVRNLYPPATLAWTQDSPGIGDAVEPDDSFGNALATGDFNGDGIKDLAIGVPNEKVGNATGAGIVQVFYGHANNGFSGDADHLLSRHDSPESDSNYGSALASGDFDKDGFADLAIGVPNANHAIKGADIGIVEVVYGSAAGLTGQRWESFWQDRSGVEETSESGDQFGAALAAGDFNNDGRDDLAIGVPREDIAGGLFGNSDAGGVNVLYGAAGGITRTGDQFWSQASDGILDDPEGWDMFGNALAAGDFNGDSRDDLAVGIPFEDVGTPVLDNDAGAVAVLYGTASGLGSVGDNFLSQDNSSIAVTGGTEGGDYNGFALAAGDFNNDGRADLAVGSHGEDLGLSLDAGVVSVLYGSSTGVADGAFQAWSQDSSSIDDGVEGGDQFGRSLAAGRLNNDSFADLVVGVPYEDFGLAWDAGAVNAIFGSSNRLTSAGDRLISQNSLGLNNASPDTIAEADDRVGTAVAIGDFDQNGRGDLAIGVPGEDVGSISNGGMVNIVNNF